MAAGHLDACQLKERRIQALRNEWDRSPMDPPVSLALAGPLAVAALGPRVRARRRRGTIHLTPSRPTCCPGQCMLFDDLEDCFDKRERALIAAQVILRK